MRYIRIITYSKAKRGILCILPYAKNTCYLFSSGVSLAFISSFFFSLSSFNRILSVSSRCSSFSSSSSLSLLLLDDCFFFFLLFFSFLCLCSLLIDRCLVGDRDFFLSLLLVSRSLWRSIERLRLLSRRLLTSPLDDLVKQSRYRLICTWELTY